VRFGAGGLGFSAGPDHALFPSEREAIARLDPEPHAQRPPFEIELVDVPPWASDDEALFPVWEPAVQRWQGERLLASHRSFTAEIDPFARHARLQRREERAYPLETVIRTSLMARLPLDGGLPLHAAGVVLDGQAIAFFGPSGAGKSTLAATSPVPVLSDELVAIAPLRPFTLARSGFWGEGRPSGRASAAPAPAAGRSRERTRARARAAAPAVAAARILSSVPVPHVPVLWERALAIVAELVGETRVVRMAWTPSAPPWDALRDWLR
jgi:hypothetical protein